MVIFGSTGTIGVNTLEVIRRDRLSFEVLGLAGKSNKKLLRAQIEEFGPRFVCLEEPDTELRVLFRR